MKIKFKYNWFRLEPFKKSIKKIFWILLKELISKMLDLIL